MNDQTAKQDAGKLRLTLVPRQIIKDIAEVRMYGVQKYPDGGPDNWKRVEKERYRDALLRHLLAYLDDPESVDEESGNVQNMQIVRKIFPIRKYMGTLQKKCTFCTEWLKINVFRPCQKQAQLIDAQS